MINLGLRLRCALGDTGVSQRELARLTGITEVTLSRYVNGNRIPKATTLKKIADALGVGLDYFFTEEELKNSIEELNNSTDLISRQAAIETAHLPTIEDAGYEVIRLDDILALPYAQPEIILCKDCKHFTRDIPCVEGHYNGCDAWTDNGNEIMVAEDDFCSYAERREEP